MAYSKKQFNEGDDADSPRQVEETAVVTPEVYESVVNGFTPRSEVTEISPAEFAEELTEKFGAEQAKQAVESALSAMNESERESGDSI